MTQLSSALYKLVNSRLAAKRKPWNPEDSVRILCDSPWKEGNELFDWYNHRTDSIIETMQLRKEHESPFFHEYVTFSLRDNAGCFRVDRHQGPNETQPLAAVYNGGVQAYDTINSIRSLDDRHYGRSDCLIEITFRDDASVPLLLLLKICRTIAQHQSARIYTVQRYSCTFYSQAIILCTLQQVFVETVQSHARGLIHSEIAIDSDVLNQEFGRSMPPTGLPNLSHQNYPAIDFVTREDECSACWKSVLVRRTVGGSNDVFSLENLSGLFWDGVVRVAEHFIQLLDVTTGSRDGSWFLCPRFYLVELCQQLTYQAVHDTWDARLRLFERNFAGHGEATPRCTCSCREPGVSSGIETTTVEHSAHDALVFTENICSPGQVGLKTRNPEIAKFFRTNINDVQQEFRNKIFQTCQKNEILRDMLSTYYQAINRRVAIQVNLRHFGQRHLGHLVSQITSQMMHPGLLSNAIDQLMKGARAKSFDLLQESRVAILHLYMLLLLHAHGGRVDIYRIWLRYDATDVVQDITQTIKEVWKLLNEKQG